MKTSPIHVARSYLAIAVFLLMLLPADPICIGNADIFIGKLSNFIIEKIAPFLAYTSLWIMGIRFHIKKHADDIPSPAVFISNHSSTLDIVTILALGLPRVRFVAKWEFQYNPLFFIMGRLTGQVFIKRQDSEKAVKSLKKAYRRIKKQKLSIFAAPEGSRKHEGVIGEFKKGAFRTALDLGYPIVPIYFEGNNKLSGEDDLYARPGECTAHIYPAIDTSGWDLKSLPEKIEEIRYMYMEWAGVDEESNWQ